MKKPTTGTALPPPRSPTVQGSQVRPAVSPGSSASTAAPKPRTRFSKPVLSSMVSAIRTKFMKERGLKLDYAPTNLEVYVNAFDGCLTGMLFSRQNLGYSLVTFGGLVASAGIWAQQFDGQWDSATALDEVQAEMILLGSYSVWAGRVSNVLTAEASLSLIAPLIGAIDVAEHYLEVEGITPGTWGGGG